MNEQQRKITRQALELATAANLDADATAPEVLELLRSGLEGDPEKFEVDTIFGLLNLVQWLLAMLEKETDRPMQDHLAYLGMRLETM